MARAVTRFTSALAATVLAIALAMGSVAQARAEDGVEPVPVPPSPAATSGTVDEPAMRQGPPPADPAEPGRGGSSATVAEARRTFVRPAAERDMQRAAASPAAVTEDPATGVDGRVVGPDLSAIAGVEIEVYADAGDYWDFYISTTSDEAGEYRIGLDPGVYAVRFVAPAVTGLASQWWRDEAAGGWAEPVEITDGLVSGIDAQLQQGGEISGTVNNRGDTGQEGIYVEAYLLVDEEIRYIDSAVTDVLGRYRLPGLPVGEYTLLFQPPNISSHIEQWWQNASRVEDATFFSLKAGETLVRNAKLVTVGGMQGRLTGLDGVPVPGVWADAYLWLGGEKISYVDSALTDENGYFRIIGLDPGWYYLYFDTSDVPEYVGKWQEHEEGGTSVIQVQDFIFPNLDDRLDAALTTARPSVSGTLAVGSRLTAKLGAWTGGTAFTYQWYADGKAISTASSIKLAKSQQGRKITVKVTGKKQGYATASVTSSATARVALAATPKISGKAKVGSTLKAKTGTWTSKTKFSYRWYANGKAIPKATKSKLKLGKSLKGKRITVVVTGKKSGYATVAKASSATRTVR